MKLRQFCPKGHDTLKVGRNPANGSCKECDRIRSRERYVPVIIDGRFIQFCPKGHNKDIVGRLSGGSCKECKRINTNTWRTQNPEKTKALIDSSNRKRRENGKFKDWYLRKNYKITLEEYNSILRKQKYCCAICEITHEEYKKTFHIDHDHKTDKIRGLLCYPCNALLGYSKDNIKILQKAISFLMEGRKDK